MINRRMSELVISNWDHHLLPTRVEVCWLVIQVLGTIEGSQKIKDKGMDRKYKIYQINISSHVTLAAVCEAISISIKGSASFLGSVIQIRGRDDLKARVCDDLLGIVNIRPLQPHDQRDLELDALAGVDDAIGDRGTVHDAAKHIHQDGLHPLVFSDDAESLPHL